MRRLIPVSRWSPEWRERWIASAGFRQRRNDSPGMTPGGRPARRANKAPRLALPAGSEREMPPLRRMRYVRVAQVSPYFVGEGLCALPFFAMITRGRPPSPKGQPSAPSGFACGARKRSAAPTILASLW